MRIDRLCLLAVLVLLASSCGATLLPDAGSSPGGAAPKTSQGAGGKGGSAGGSGSGVGSGKGSGGASTAGYDDGGSLGSMVRTFLRAAPAKALSVEVDYVKGRAPSSRALAHLRDVIAGVADKPGGVSVEAGNEIGSGRDSWSIGEIKALERANRNGHSSGDTATMWLVYLDGSFAEESSALGVAYSASAAAIFRDRIDDATTSLVNETAIERAVLTHEVGHILALVNLGYKSSIDHEDAGHPHHSNNRGSVMYWAVEDVSIGNILAGGPPSTFDDADKADLEMLKRG